MAGAPAAVTGTAVATHGAITAAEAAESLIELISKGGILRINSGSGGVNDDDLWAQVERDFNQVEIRPEARRISNGHAFRDHRFEFERIGIRSQEELAEHISNIMNNPSDVRIFSRNRTAYWDDATGTVVVYDENDLIKNETAFIPDEEKYYFDVKLE